MKKLLLLLLLVPSAYAMNNNNKSDEAPKSPRTLCRARIQALKNRLNDPYYYSGSGGSGSETTAGYAIQGLGELHAKIANDAIKKDLFEAEMLLIKLEAKANKKKQQQEQKSTEK